MKNRVLKDMMTTVAASFKQAPWITSILMLLSVILGLIPRFSLFLVEKIQTYAFSAEEKWGLFICGILLLWGFTDLCQQLLGELRVYLSMHVQIRLKMHFSGTLINCLMEAPAENFENPEFQNSIKRASEAANGETLWNYILTIFFLLVNIISAISVAAYISHENIVVLFLLCLTVLCHFIWLFLSQKEEVDQEIRLADKKRRASYYYKFFWKRAENRNIRIYRLKTFMKGKWSETTEEIYEERRRVRKKYLRLYLIVFLFLCLTLFLAVPRNRFAANPERIVPTLLGFVCFLEAVSLAMEDIVSLFSTEIYLQDYFYITKQMPCENVESENTDTENTAEDVLVSMRNVCFAYPGTGGKEVLKNINVDLKKDDIVAVVGENGAGKSTFIKLLLGIYHPTKGSITYSRDFAEKRDAFAAEFQNFIKYEYTLFENVGLGDDVLYEDDKKIMQAIKKAELEELAETLPMKEKQRLGKLFENGVDLSGGQWQKVGLARACLRDSLLVSLDEPTANLDPNTEAMVFDLFLKKHDNNAVFFAAHRIGPAKMANRILVFQDGEIVEDGTHEALLAKGGVYRKMYDTLAKRYEIDPNKI